MALIPAKTIITSLCLFHITIGFFFVSNPATVADQAVVWVLGESMGLAHDPIFEAPSSALAFLGVVLAMVGMTDLVTLSLPEDISLVHHWGLQAPLRLTISFALVLYSFFFGASSPLYSGDSRRHPTRHPSTHTHNPSYQPSTWGGDGLKNSVFFAFMFVEMISWFWIWVTLREERQSVPARRPGRRVSNGHLR